jgi:hypothetical protein
MKLEGVENFPLVSEDRGVQCAYEEMRRSGESHAIAEILALRQTPASRTDREFLLGDVNCNQFAADPESGKLYRSVAEQSGVSVAGKKYISQLARFPGDPQAWVSGRGDVERVCRKNGWGCSGMVNVKPGPTPYRPNEPVGEDIVMEEVDSVIRKNPDAALGRKEIAAEVRKNVSPSWSPIRNEDGRPSSLGNRSVASARRGRK